VHRERVLIIALLGFSVISLYLPKDTSLFMYRRFNRSIIVPFQVVIGEIEVYKNAVRRSEELGKENFRLSLALHAMRMIEAENIRLRSLLNFSTEKGVDFIAARVIGYNLSGPLNTISVDKGEVDGVRPFLPVLTPGGLVGKVTEVDKRLSIVELYTSNEFSVSGMVVECGEVGIVSPRGTGKLYLEGLNLRTGVKAGDRVVSSGLGGIFPVGIPVGIVETIELDPLGVHRVASIIPQVRLDKVREVFILSDSRYVKADPLWLTRSGGSLSSLWKDFSNDTLVRAGDSTQLETTGRDGE
jgi:rod shape-determining protein MreC